MGASCAVNAGCAIQDDSLPEYGGSRPVSPVENADNYNIHHRGKISFDYNNNHDHNNDNSNQNQTQHNNNDNSNGNTNGKK